MTPKPPAGPGRSRESPRAGNKRGACKAQREILKELKDQKKAEREEAKPKVGPVVAIGEVVAGSDSKRKYVVDKLIGIGGFSEVYQVHSETHPSRKYAMKTEICDDRYREKHMRRLKCEVHLFKEIAMADSELYDLTHFLRMLDRGKHTNFYWIVTNLFWVPLKEVVETVTKARLSQHTLIAVARQTLAAIQTLHALGFLHRDVKPGNFAIGLPPKDGTIFLYDFGISRYYRDPATGSSTVPRKRVNFIGTFKYGSVRALENKEQAPLDDLESWIYMMIELYYPANVTWRSLKWSEKEEALNLRKALMSDPAGVKRKGRLCLPEPFLDIIHSVYNMGYHDLGDYKRIHAQLDRIVVQNKIDMSLPLDWLGKCPIKQPEPEKPEKTREEQQQPRRDGRKDEAWKDDGSPKAAAPKKKDARDAKFTTEEGSSKDRHKKRSSGSTPGEYSEYDSEESEGEQFEKFIRWQMACKKERYERRKKEEAEREELKAAKRAKYSRIALAGPAGAKERLTQKDRQTEETREDHQPREREGKTRADQTVEATRDEDKPREKKDRKKPEDKLVVEETQQKERKKRVEKTQENTREERQPLDKDRKKSEEKLVVEETQQKDRKRKEERPVETKDKPDKKAVADKTVADEVPAAARKPSPAVAESAKANAIRRDRKVEMKKH